MPDWLQDILKLLAGGTLVLLGQLVAFWRLKWKTGEDRKTTFAEMRRPLYSRALELIFETGRNTTNANELFRIVEEWEKWIPASAAYLSPAAVDLLNQLMNATGIIAVNLAGEGRRGREASEFFEESLQAAKAFFANSKDIAWLPDDLSMGKK